MKIKKLIKILECIEGDYKGELPRDMYELSSYTKENGGWIGIDDMDFVHVMRAFEKMQEEKFRQRVFQIMDEEVIMKFDKREGNAKEFYDAEGEGEA